MGRKSNKKLWEHLINELNDFSIRAGWFENSRYDDNTPIAYIAAIQNYGATVRVANNFRNYLHYIGIHLKKDKGEFVIPPRPFMDNAKNRINGQEGKEILTQELLRVFEGRQTMQQAINRIGLWMQGVIQDEIKKLNAPKLSGMTIEMREKSYVTKSAAGNKSTKPLNNTGVMYSTVQYKAETKEK